MFSADRHLIALHYLRYRVAVAVLVAGLSVSSALFFVLQRWEHRAEQAAVLAMATQRLEVLRETLGNSLETLHALGSYFSTNGLVDRTHFRRFVADALARRPEVQGLSWTPRVPAAQRKFYEAAARAEGFSQFRFTEPDPKTGEMRSAQNRSDFYYPVYYIEPLEKNSPAFGYDLNARIDTLVQARDSAQAIATPTVQLMQEKAHELGFIVYLPLYNNGIPPTLAKRVEDNTGFVAIVFRVADLFGPALAHLPGMRATLRDSADGQAAIVYSAAPADEAPPDGSLSPCTLNLPFAGREWQINFVPTTAFARVNSPWQSWAFLSAGLALTGLLTSYLLLSLRRSSETVAANATLQREIAVRQRAEDAAASANRAKSDFLSSLSHEIRTPLNSILGYTQILERDPTLPRRHRDAVAALSNGGHHLLGLLNSILDLSKIEAGQMELQRGPFDVHALVHGLAQMFKPRCEEKQILLRVDCQDQGSYSVIGDEGKLRQILINLIGNAIKFTPRGEIYVSAKKISAETDHWRFEVIDTGIGLTPAEQAGLGAPFHQAAAGRRLGGTGLGLAIVRGHLELMGSQLRLTSEPGLGTRVHFDLDLPPAAISPATVRNQVLPRLAKGVDLRALVVDDNKDNRIILSKLLAELGCLVADAGTPEHARDIVRQTAPNIVFIDVRLGALSGADLLTLLQQEGLPKTSVVVFHTAALLARAEIDALRARNATLLAKPFRIEELCACLQQVPGVSFIESVDLHKEPTVLSSEDLLNVVVSQELAERITVAAQLHSTTVLKACLEELRALGGSSVGLADHLRHLLRSYDHAGVARLVSKLPVEAASRFHDATA